MAETASRYERSLAATLSGGFTPACINDTEIMPPYIFTPWALRKEVFYYKKGKTDAKIERS